MANTSSAKKAIRQQEKKHVQNLRRHRDYRDARKVVEKAITDGDATQATTALSTFNKALGKAAKHNGPLHKNTAARYMSRMAQKVASAFSQ
jgi:small subunit ribosomal protein S20